MKKEDLMVGDWYSIPTTASRSRCRKYRERMVMLDYNDLYEYDEIEPIPMTAEILAQNGFSKSRLMGEQRHFTYYIGPSLSMLAIYDADFSVHIGDGARYVKNVHQFQHILKDCGIDKEIIIKEE